MTDDISSGWSEPQHISTEGTDRRDEVQNFRQIATLNVTDSDNDTFDSTQGIDAPGGYKHSIQNACNPSNLNHSQQLQVLKIIDAIHLEPILMNSTNNLNRSVLAQQDITAEICGYEYRSLSPVRPK